MSDKDAAYEELKVLEDAYGETDVSAIRAALDAQPSAPAPSMAPADNRRITPRSGRVGMPDAPAEQMSPHEKHEDDLLRAITSGDNAEVQRLRFQPGVDVAPPGVVGDKA